ncbi:MAG: DUF2634 domain-containing protein [Lachnospirales bacterium]
MLPNLGLAINEAITVVDPKSKNYRMYLEKEFIKGYANEKEAMKQVIFKILMTERYRHLIYSWNYGIELEDLFGMPVNYVVPEVERRIVEALVQDDRINSVDGFVFDLSKRHIVAVSFVAHTIYGDVNGSREVSV